MEEGWTEIADRDFDVDDLDPGDAIVNHWQGHGQAHPHKYTYLIRDEVLNSAARDRARSLVSGDVRVGAPIGHGSTARPPSSKIALGISVPSRL